MDKYIRTDLAFELVGPVKKVKKLYRNIDIIDINIDKKDSKIVGKRAGKYITINYNYDLVNTSKLVKIFSLELIKMMKKNGIKNDKYGLIIGLGNENSTPDSLGPIAINNIFVTNHLIELGLNNKYMRISSFKPGVYGSNGIDTNKMIKGIIKEIKPDYLIIIDALVTKSYDRLYNTIQITDTGIEPGRYGCIINKDIYGIPVISIGIPTVLEISNSKFLVTSNDIDFVIKKISNILSDGINIIIKNKDNI